MRKNKAQEIEIVKDDNDHSTWSEFISIRAIANKDSVKISIEDDYYLVGDGCFMVDTGFNLNIKQVKNLHCFLENWLKTHNQSLDSTTKSRGKSA